MFSSKLHTHTHTHTLLSYLVTLGRFTICIHFSLFILPLCLFVFVDQLYYEVLQKGLRRGFLLFYDIPISTT